MQHSDDFGELEVLEAEEFEVATRSVYLLMVLEEPQGVKAEEVGVPTAAAVEAIVAVVAEAVIAIGYGEDPIVD